MDISGMAFTDEVSSLQPGMHIGDLQISSFLGKGAIGEVYLARHDVLEQEFAVKVIPKGFSAGEADEVFEHVAQIQSRLDHPNIVRIDDMGDEGVFYWLRMERIIGEETAEKETILNLEELLEFRQEPLSEAEVKYYLYFLLVGLDHGHTEGVFHDDLKPANVMIVEEGVKVAEFGLTELIGHAWDDFHIRRLDPRLEPTPFDPLPGFSRELPALLATFDYYSPEQRAGRHADARSNLYSVGLMAYRMLTGRFGFSIEFPSQVVDGISQEWDAWIKQALAYDPQDRFESAADMLCAMPGLQGEEEAHADDSSEELAL